MQVTDEDLDPLHFSLDMSGQGFFTLVDAGPSSVELYFTSSPDREAVAAYQFRMFVLDGGVPPLVGQTEVSIIVLVGVNGYRGWGGDHVGGGW